MKESIILKYIWLLSGNFMIAILLAACNGSNIIPDNPDEEIEIIPEPVSYTHLTLPTIA